MKEKKTKSTPRILNLKCECSTEMLEIVYDRKDKQYDICIWTPQNNTSRLRWFQRIRHAWQIVCTGRPYGDQLILSQASLERLGKFVTDQSVTTATK